MVLFLHEMKRSLKSLLIWSAAVGGMILICMLMFPEMESQMGDVEKMFANMGGFTKAFGMDEINFGEVMGFYGIECGNMLGIGGALFAALCGISALSKEETSHTAEFLLTHPKRRVSFITPKLLSVIAQIIAFNLICAACSLVSFAIIGEAVAWHGFWLFHIAQLIMHIQIALVCFGISAFVRRGGIGIGLGIAMLLYFFNIFVNIGEKTEFMKYLTPFQYCEASDLMKDASSLDAVLIAVGLATGAAFTVCGYIKYMKKDITA